MRACVCLLLCTVGTCTYAECGLRPSCSLTVVKGTEQPEEKLQRLKKEAADLQATARSDSLALGFYNDSNRVNCKHQEAWENVVRREAPSAAVGQAAAKVYQAHRAVAEAHATTDADAKMCVLCISAMTLVHVL